MTIKGAYLYPESPQEAAVFMACPVDQLRGDLPDYQPVCGRLAVIQEINEMPYIVWEVEPDVLYEATDIRIHRDVVREVLKPDIWMFWWTDEDHDTDDPNYARPFHGDEEVTAITANAITTGKPVGDLRTLKEWIDEH